MTIYQAAMAWLILNEVVALAFLRRAKMRGQSVKGGHRRLSASLGKYAPARSIWLSEAMLERGEVPHPLIHVTPSRIFLLLTVGLVVSAASLFVALLMGL